MTASYRWMRDLLELLFQHVPDDTAVRMLRDPAERASVLDSTPALAAFRTQCTSVDVQEFDNLLVALLALRLRFDRATAAEKVELNIAMREGRR